MPGTKVTGFGVGGAGLGQIIQGSRELDIASKQAREAKRRRRQDLMLQIAGLTRQGLGDIVGAVQTGEELGIRGKMAEAATKQAETAGRELLMRYPMVEPIGGTGQVPLNVAEWQQRKSEFERLHPLVSAPGGGSQVPIAAAKHYLDVGETEDVARHRRVLESQGEKGLGLEELSIKLRPEMQATEIAAAGERFMETQGLKREKMAQDYELALKALAATPTPEQEIATTTKGAVRAEDVQAIRKNPFFLALPAPEQKRILDSIVEQGITPPVVGGLEELLRLAASPEAGLEEGSLLPEGLRALGQEPADVRAYELTDILDRMMRTRRAGPAGDEALRLFAQQAAPYLPGVEAVPKPFPFPGAWISPQDYIKTVQRLMLLKKLSEGAPAASAPMPAR